MPSSSSEDGGRSSVDGEPRTADGQTPAAGDGQGRTAEEEGRSYFCTEPWTGIFSVETNLDVTFCPCFLKMRIGNLNDSPIGEIWNSEKLVELRRSFSEGKLPDPCYGQLCGVAAGTSPKGGASAALRVIG